MLLEQGPLPVEQEVEQFLRVIEQIVPHKKPVAEYHKPLSVALIGIIHLNSKLYEPGSPMIILQPEVETVKTVVVYANRIHGSIFLWYLYTRNIKRTNQAKSLNPTVLVIE